MTIKLIADSTCDLPGDFIKKHNIRIVPLSIAIGNNVLRDGIDVTSQDIFNYMDSGSGVVHTSAVNSAEYADIYREELQNSDAIIHFIVSSEMSSCYQNACLAAEEFENIYLVDSRNLSIAIGHLVIDAAELIAEGLPAEDVHRKIISRIALLDASFVLDTLSYLHRGGRCTAIQALVSGTLKIKPCINVIDGKMTVGKKYRGKLEYVLRRYIEDKLSETNHIDTRRIFVNHTMTEQNRILVDMVKSLVAEIIPFKEVYETKAGGTISCHCGPNALGIFFFRKS